MGRLVAAKNGGCNRTFQIFQPGGLVRIGAQPLKQASRSNSQLGPITRGTTVVTTCWVPTVGGRVPVPRTLTHVSNVARQLEVQSITICAILFFGMGEKLPAKLAWLDAKRIIAAKLSFIFIPQAVAEDADGVAGLVSNACPAMICGGFDYVPFKGIHPDR